MTKEEARARIESEFIGGFYEWLKDEKELPEMEFAKKYGWMRRGEHAKTHKDNLAGVAVYQKYFHRMRRNEDFTAAGYDIRAIWELARDGFLSETQRNWKSCFFISQKTAKEILKRYKA